MEKTYTRSVPLFKDASDGPPAWSSGLGLRPDVVGKLTA
jgi:hypothetical protein